MWYVEVMSQKTSRGRNRRQVRKGERFSGALQREGKGRKMPAGIQIELVSQRAMACMSEKKYSITRAVVLTEASGEKLQKRKGQPIRCSRGLNQGDYLSQHKKKGRGEKKKAHSQNARKRLVGILYARKTGRDEERIQ